jgi:hypothetical protein
MKPSTITFLATLGFGVLPVVAADATSPIDYTQRNQPYTPADSVRGEKQKPATNGSVQEKRVEKTMVEKQKSSLREREAAVDVKEARPKQVREKESYPTEVVEHKTSDFNHQASAYSTASGTSKPPMVARYQDSLTAANAIKVKTTSALSRATAATINRFVFRKNPPEPPAGPGGPVTPAAGGSALQK